MPTDQAEICAGKLLGSYPGWPVGEVNLAVLAEAFDNMGLDIAPAVVEEAQRSFAKPPSVAQLYDTARELRADADRFERVAIPAGPEALEPFPPEVAEKVKAMIDGMGKVRRRQAEIAEADAEWKRLKAKTLTDPSSRRRLGLCDGTGKFVVERDGKRVCPDCGEEVPDQLVRIPRREVAR